MDRCWGWMSGGGWGGWMSGLLGGWVGGWVGVGVCGMIEWTKATAGG